MTRPVPLRVHADGIPLAMRTEPRWCLWRYELRGERWTKAPLQVSGRYAKSDDASTWNTFERVLWVYERGGYDGLEFMLGNGWSGIDVDHCHVDEPFVSTIPCYVEPSPSGTGFKGFGRSPRIGGQANFATTPPVFTTWSGPRPFTVTGHGHGDPTVDITTFLDDWFPAKPAPTVSQTGFALAAVTNDYDLLLQAFGSDNGDKTLALYQGDLAAYDNDHSRADQALVSILAFWCNYDLARVDRLFRLSGLMRDKWNAGSYRSATLAKVMR